MNEISEQFYDPGEIRGYPATSLPPAKGRKSRNYENVDVNFLFFRKYFLECICA